MAGGSLNMILSGAGHVVIPSSFAGVLFLVLLSFVFLILIDPNTPSDSNPDTRNCYKAHSTPLVLVLICLPGSA